MMTKTDRRRSNFTERGVNFPSPYEKPAKPFLERRNPKGKIGKDEDDDVSGGDLGTFVVRGREEEEENDEEGGSGTMVMNGSGGGGGTMRRAVESMRKAREVFGIGRQRKNSGGGKVSSSSIPDCVTREDPLTKYELLHELGKGSYGAVYKARDLRTSELVAIKLISLSEGEEGYEEIRAEIEMLQQCSHPNVVRYLGSYQGEEFFWIVMEYCGGGSVADLMNVLDKPLEENQIAYICRGALKFIGTPHWMAPELIQESRYDGKVYPLSLDAHVCVWTRGL